MAPHETSSRIGPADGDLPEAGAPVYSAGASQSVSLPEGMSGAAWKEACRIIHEWEFESGSIDYSELAILLWKLFAQSDSRRRTATDERSSRE